MIVFCYNVGDKQSTNLLTAIFAVLLEVVIYPVKQIT